MTSLMPILRQLTMIITSAVNMHQNINNEIQGLGEEKTKTKKHHKLHEIYCHRNGINFTVWHERICPSVVMPSVLFHSLNLTWRVNKSMASKIVQRVEEFIGAANEKWKNKNWELQSQHTAQSTPYTNVSSVGTVFRLRFGINCCDRRHENRVFEKNYFCLIWQQCNEPEGGWDRGGRSGAQNRVRCSVVFCFFFCWKNGVKCNLCTYGTHTRNIAIALALHTVAESILRAYDLLYALQLQLLPLICTLMRNKQLSLSPIFRMQRCPISVRFKWTNSQHHFGVEQRHQISQN